MRASYHVYKEPLADGAKARPTNHPHAGNSSISVLEICNKMRKSFITICNISLENDIYHMEEWLLGPEAGVSL
ncbi:predicted protein [Sclerotinia sclerotiorum 1980 UF-70]|uniref:Uncharacterized protein n=1 Tax=Sclerotinia sclerotiorum (strain ATCC 18683 / 1980 / Ss-1) TaxID=665079 RepID=A7F6J0_SCLS1|nr:predicted protein [Sclerotinia sclerotiorum 1980 UF-70]EDN98361.1 predicted protein [Sclerotinia sclerotiorum 1980 UF-70]